MSAAAPPRPAAEMVPPAASAISGARYAQPALCTPAAALDAFYGAFNGRDLAALRGIWGEADIAMANPLGGIRHGWTAISEGYARLFASPARMAVEFWDCTLTEIGDMFVAVGRERGTLVREDMVLPLAFRTSRVFRKDGQGRWRQQHHHGSAEDPWLLASLREMVLG